MTKSQVELLTRYRIVPVCIVELTVSDAEVLRRGDGDRTSSSRCVLHVHLCLGFAGMLPSIQKAPNAR